MAGADWRGKSDESEWRVGVAGVKWWGRNGGHGAAGTEWRDGLARTAWRERRGGDGVVGVEW